MRIRIKICGVTSPESALAAAEAGADSVGLVFVPASPRMIDGDTALRIVECLPPFVEPVGLFVDVSSAEVRRIAQACRIRTVQLHGREGPGFVRELVPLRVIKALSFEPHHFAGRLALWRSPCPNLCALIVDAPPPIPPVPPEPPAEGPAKLQRSREAPPEVPGLASEGRAMPPRNDAWDQAGSKTAAGELIEPSAAHVPPGFTPSPNPLPRSAPGDNATVGGMTGGHGVPWDWNHLAELRQGGRLEGLPPVILAGGLTPENVGRAIQTFRPWGVDVSSGVEEARGIKSAQRIAEFCLAVREAERQLQEASGDESQVPPVR